jgi:hypothetical protein
MRGDLDRNIISSPRRANSYKRALWIVRSNSAHSPYTHRLSHASKGGFIKLILVSRVSFALLNAQSPQLYNNF